MVGNMMEDRTGAVGTLHKYGLLIGLGYVTTELGQIAFGSP